MNVTQKPRLHQDWIDPHAVGIVRALQKAGFTTYLVGGCVRDLLLGIHPKDFDIATTAKPDQVKRVIHRAYVIGKRFRLVLVRREEAQFEVATFRRELREEEKGEEAPSGDNVFGTPEEDARRRDFTINALFYDPIADQLIDHADGLADLEARWVRMIGDPSTRLVEDPIRILRALRLKHMIGFALEPGLRRAIVESAHTLPTTALPRRREEILKLLRLHHPDLAFREAHDLGVLKWLSPNLDVALAGEACEDLYAGLRQIGEYGVANLNPAELFGLLVHAYVRACVQPDPSAGTRAREILEDEAFQTWMRDELGMFKFEQALAVKALHVEPLLARRKEFQKRGERRQRALVTNDAFPLALRYAERDHCLPCEDFLYWQQKYTTLREQNPLTNIRHKRRRPRRPRRNGPNAKAAEDSGANASSTDKSEARS
ncbi:MAG: poly(A) polymerase [Bdellovibrionales bacterium]